MTYRGLADFLGLLEEKEELRRVQAEAHNDRELAETTSRQIADNNSAVLFGKVTGHRLPVVTHLFGNERRVWLGLGAHSLAEVAARYSAILRVQTESGAESDAFAPKRVKTAPCQQVVRLGSDIDLADLSIPTADGSSSRMLTGAVVHWRDETSRQRRGGCLHLQVIDRARLGICIPPDSPLQHTVDEARTRGAHIPLTVSLSGDPSIWLAAMLPAFGKRDFAVVAGALRGAPLEITACRTHDLEAPAESELIFEGHLHSRETITADPFVDDLGWYTETSAMSVLELSAVTHRSSPIVPVVTVGCPPHELCNRRRVVARLMLPLVQSLAPAVVDYSFPDFGAARHYCFVSIRKTYAHQAAKVARLLVGMEPFAATKFVVVVDEQVHIHDPHDVWRHVAANVYPERDVQTLAGPGALFDHSAPAAQSGSQLVIDATAKLPGEHPRPWPNVVD